jgi:pantothenate kinase-related protein Tda10
MSSSDYVSGGFKDLSNMTTEGYYISESFLDKMTVHIAKNFMGIPNIKVPLILGVWGGKGQGKTFQSDLIFKKLGVVGLYKLNPAKDMPPFTAARKALRLRREVEVNPQLASAWFQPLNL